MWPFRRANCGEQAVLIGLGEPRFLGRFGLIRKLVGCRSWHRLFDARNGTPGLLDGNGVLPPDVCSTMPPNVEGRNDASNGGGRGKS